MHTKNMIYSWRRVFCQISATSRYTYYQNQISLFRYCTLSSHYPYLSLHLCLPIYLSSSPSSCEHVTATDYITHRVAFPSLSTDHSCVSCLRHRRHLRCCSHSTMLLQPLLQWLLPVRLLHFQCLRYSHHQSGPHSPTNRPCSPPCGVLNNPDRACT